VNRISENYKKIELSLIKHAKMSNRDSNSVRLLAVSKKKSIEDILAAASAGQRDFGENFVQEAIEKIKKCQHNLTWHFIGHLQSNKTKLVAENFQWVHTIDRMKIAQRLSDQRPKNKPKLNICIEVNINSESQKSGVEPQDLLELAHNIKDLPYIRLRGLMCIPSIEVEFEKQKMSFAKLRHLKNELNTLGFNLDTLSMGMSSDYPAAIYEGATIVRIGTALFGERK